jgi:hypothetical protein
MLNHTAQVVLVAIFSASTALWATAEESPPVTLPLEHGYVVLRNGAVFDGKISRDETTYYIDMDNGQSQVSLKLADVDLVCKDLEEGYRQKRALIQVGNIHQHLELAQWCLRQNLLGSAGIELADAAAVNPKNPMVVILQNRLKLALEPPAPGSTKTQINGPSNNELDRMVRSMPRGVVENFTQSMQPMLLNHCAASGCHSAQSESGLRLYRISTDRASNRRTTQRNLYSVLQFVDQRNLSASKLLAAASQPHGTVQHAVFSDRQTPQLRRMVDWLGLFAQQSPLEVPGSVATLPSSAPPTANAVVPAGYNEPVDPFDPEAFNRGRSPGRAKANP